MIVHLPPEFEAGLKARALLRGLSLDSYVRDVLERDLHLAEDLKRTGVPFVSGFGICAGLGPAPSAEEIDANREEMFRGFGEDF